MVRDGLRQCAQFDDDDRSRRRRAPHRCGQPTQPFLLFVFWWGGHIIHTHASSSAIVSCIALFIYVSSFFASHSSIYAPLICSFGGALSLLLAYLSRLKLFHYSRMPRGLCLKFALIWKIC